jgi:hypothetical protein
MPRFNRILGRQDIIRPRHLVSCALALEANDREGCEKKEDPQEGYKEKEGEEAAALKSLWANVALNEVKVAGEQLRLENPRQSYRFMAIGCVGRTSVAAIVWCAQGRFLALNRRADVLTRVIIWIGVQRSILVDIGEFERKALAVAISPRADTPIRAAGDRWIVYDGTAVAVAGKAEIRCLIGAVKVKRRVVRAVAHREHIGFRIIAFGE